ncbi:PsiF family protein [Azoarcus sp. L1K30]|uniref:PsiF family protein n=1 Tax=Azoarcus sp. L1K30 TaxID=2820277 RepID=UPI002012F604|nr:PsiF family protein [Azoarcus sp. L1K30]
MSTCLKGKHEGSAAPAAAATGGKDSAKAAPAVVADVARTKQKDRMKACNQQAGEQSLKGEARKTFMAECLKG